jgi:hypothetical protein
MQVIGSHIRAKPLLMISWSDRMVSRFPPRPCRGFEGIYVLLLGCGYASSHPGILLANNTNLPQYFCSQLTHNWQHDMVAFKNELEIQTRLL